MRFYFAFNNISVIPRQQLTLVMMGVDRSTAGAAFAAPIILLVRHATPIKSVDKILRKYLKKKKKRKQNLC